MAPMLENQRSPTRNRTTGEQAGGTARPTFHTGPPCHVCGHFGGAQAAGPTGTQTFPHSAPASAQRISLPSAGGPHAAPPPPPPGAPGMPTQPHRTHLAMGKALSGRPTGMAEGATMDGRHRHSVLHHFEEHAARTLPAAPQAKFQGHTLPLQERARVLRLALCTLQKLVKSGSPEHRADAPIFPLREGGGRARQILQGISTRLWGEAKLPKPRTQSCAGERHNRRLRPRVTWPPHPLFHHTRAQPTNYRRALRVNGCASRRPCAVPEATMHQGMLTIDRCPRSARRTDCRRARTAP